MIRKSIGIAGIITMAGMLGSIAFAQDVRTQAAMEKDIASLNQQISSKQQQINALRNRPSPEQAEVAAAEKALENARADLKAKPDSDNEGRVRNAEFKLKLAQIKFDKSNNEIDSLNDDVSRLRQQVLARQQQVKEAGRQVAVPADLPTPQQANADRAKRQQEQELLRAKQDAEAARKEIERLKAALAVKEAGEAKAQAAAPVAAAAVDPAAAKAASAVAVAPAAAQAVAKQSASATAGPVKLKSQQDVLRALQKTAELTANADTRRTINQSLYIKQPNVAATNKDKITLHGLGNNQYRGSSNIASGEYEAVLGFNRWPATFAASEACEQTFLLDYSDDKTPRLIIYSSALEGGK